MQCQPEKKLRESTAGGEGGGEAVGARSPMGETHRRGAGNRSCWWMESTLAEKNSRNLEQRSGSSGVGESAGGWSRRFMVKKSVLGWSCCEWMRVE